MIILACFAVFLFMSTAIFLVGGLDETIAEELRRGKKAGSIRLRRRTALTRLASLEQRRRSLVRDVQLSEPSYWLLTALTAACGAVIGRYFFSGMFFAVIVGLLGALGPILYLSHKRTQAKSRRIEKLQASMMLLSGAYIVTEDFVQAVQDNIDVLEYPLPFRNFLTYVSLIDGSVKTGLRRMELQVDNPFFSQWIDALVLAQDDRGLKTVAMSVVDAMNDVH